MDIPPGYYNLSGSLQSGRVEVGNVADLFLKKLVVTGKTKLGVKYVADGWKIIYLLNSDDNTISKRERSVSGTLTEYTWRGDYMERLKYAHENNNFNPPGSSAVEVKNLYH